MGFLFLSLFFFVGAVSATNHTVTPSDSIQSKIDGASSGDTLNLATGTYYQYNIKVNKSLTIAGPTTTGTPTAVIDAYNQGRVFNITEDTNVILKYLTITNGNTTKDTLPSYGGGILNQGNCTIVGCKINSNAAQYGGGIYNTGTCTVTGSNINTNTATYGGGIYNTGICTVTGSNINTNIAYYGGGVYNDEGNCTVNGCNINSNTATNGGGIYNDHGTCTVTNCIITNNTAEKLTTPILLSPDNNTMFNHYPRTLTLAWTPVAGATGYKVERQWYDFGYPDWVAYSDVTVNGELNSSYTFDFVGDQPGRWRVTALSTFNSNPSEWWYFDFRTGISQLTLDLKSPGNNTLFNHYPRTLTLVWTPVAGATGYKVERQWYIGGNPDWVAYSDVTVNGELNSSYTFDFIGDQPGRWRVTALSTFNSNPSEWWYFDFKTGIRNDGGGIYNYYGTCTVTGSNININTATNGGGIYNDHGTCTVTGSNIKSNTAKTSGGGIHNYGSCTVTASNINTNTASDGGGICNYYGTCTVTGSNISSNTAYNGGGILNYDSCTLNNSNLNSNTAKTSGGGIYNYYGTCTITGCNFESNEASDSGNAIFNGNGDISTRIFHFNRFYDTYPGYEIYSYSGSVDAMFNWWGSNTNPSSKVYGTVDTSPWLVLKLTSSPTLIGNSAKSNLTADLRYDSLGIYHNPSNGYFPNNIPIQFTTTLGSITSPISTSSGTAKATLTSGSTNGVADVFALLDDEIVATTVNIDAILPTITTIDPTNNAVNVARNKVIKVTFSEPIKAGHMWIELYNTNGTKTPIPITTSISGNVLTINHTALLTTGTKYILCFHTGSITDLAGNSLAGVASYFTTSTDGTSPIITSTDPANNAVNVPRNKVIKVTFSEPIKAGTMWIELYNTNGTKTPIPITTSISGNVLTINHTALLTTGTKYILCFHTGSITDLAGNSLAGVASYFTTSTDGTSPIITSTDPANNAVNVPRNKVITVTFNEPIKAGTMWIELYNTNGTKTPIPITTSINGNVLTINHAALLATGTKYTLALHTGSVTDSAGNPVASAVRYFTTGST